MQYKKIILSFFLFLSLHNASVAQRPEFGLNIGGAGYIGDLNQFNPMKISGLNGGIFGKINFDPHWGLGLHFNYGRIRGDDANSKNPQFVERNLNFLTSLNEIAFIGSFNLFDMYSPGSRKRLTPYLFLGVGGVVFNPNYIYKSSDGTETVYSLKNLNTEQLPEHYRRHSIVIPFGAGVKYKKSDNWTLFGQLGYRATFTDYLDDVSGVYPSVSEEDPRNNFYNVTDRSGYINGGTNLYRPGDQRGDFRKRDTYLFVNIGISYTFVSQKCFTF